MTYEHKGKVVLGVHDTGPGIPAKVLKKLGTPYTTRKKAAPAWGCRSATALPTATARKSMSRPRQEERLLQSVFR